MSTKTKVLWFLAGAVIAALAVYLINTRQANRRCESRFGASVGARLIGWRFYCVGKDVQTVRGRANE